MELIEEYQHTNIPSTDNMHLMKEAHLAVRGHEFKHGVMDENVAAFRKESAASLADFYTK